MLNTGNTCGDCWIWDFVVIKSNSLKEFKSQDDEDGNCWSTPKFADPADDPEISLFSQCVLIYNLIKEHRELENHHFQQVNDV